MQSEMAKSIPLQTALEAWRIGSHPENYILLQGETSKWLLNKNGRTVSEGKGNESERLWRKTVSAMKPSCPQPLHGPPTVQAMQGMQEKLLAWSSFGEASLSNCGQKYVFEGKIPYVTPAKSPSPQMWPQVLIPKETKLGKQGGLEQNCEMVLCSWHLWVSSGAFLSHNA